MPTPTGWVWPSGNTKLSGYHYTQNHHAIDIGARTGDKILAPTSGKVTYAGYDAGGYGNYVVITTTEGYKVYLAHLSKIQTRIGEKVSPGEQIGLAGSTGNSTGPHLHFEIRTPGGGGWLNPYSIYGNNPKPGKVTIPATGTGTTGTGNNPSNPVAYPLGNPGGTTSAIDLSGLNPLEPLRELADRFSVWWNNINWNNLAGVGVGTILVAAGIYGLVQAEAGNIIGEAVGSAVSSLAGGGEE